MSTTAENRLEEIDAAMLKAWMDKGEALLVDVREPSEHAGERILGARLVPLSSFNPAQVPQEPNKKVVLHCLTGTRSTQAGRKLLGAGFGRVYNLKGGLQAWKGAGYAVEYNPNAPISLLRQVQIVAGTLVVLGTVLGAAVSPWFLLLSGFVGAGLMFAGITNTCGMAMLLAKLPYNRRSQAISSLK
ncbi:MAG: rhodanese-like domain-containing protein [Candidatus Binatia bacterium]